MKILSFERDLENIIKNMENKWWIREISDLLTNISKNKYVKLWWFDKELSKNDIRNKRKWKFIATWYHYKKGEYNETSNKYILVLSVDLLENWKKIKEKGEINIFITLGNIL